MKNNNSQDDENVKQTLQLFYLREYIASNNRAKWKNCLNVMTKEEHKNYSGVST